MRNSFKEGKNKSEIFSFFSSFNLTLFPAQLLFHVGCCFSYIRREFLTSTTSVTGLCAHSEISVKLSLTKISEHVLRGNIMCNITCSRAFSSSYDRNVILKGKTHCSFCPIVDQRQKGDEHNGVLISETTRKKKKGSSSNRTCQRHEKTRWTFEGGVIGGSHFNYAACRECLRSTHLDNEHALGNMRKEKKDKQRQTSVQH